MTVHLTGHNNSLLRCEVNVTWDPGFVLSVLYDGCKLQPVDSAPLRDTGAALPYVTLSETVSLRSEGEYECQLHLNEQLITKSIFNYQPGNNLSSFHACTLNIISNINSDIFAA